MAQRNYLQGSSGEQTRGSGGGEAEDGRQEGDPDRYGPHAESWPEPVGARAPPELCGDPGDGGFRRRGCMHTPLIHCAHSRS